MELNLVLRSGVMGITLSFQLMKDQGGRGRELGFGFLGGWLSSLSGN
ncbi:MAG: hypothetical protein AB3N28_04505 [Kordiimonas sp.]